MKKWIALITVLICLALAPAVAEETVQPEAATTAPADDADKIEVHRYESKLGKFYFYIPTDWFFIGRDAFEDDLIAAREAMGARADELLDQMTEENDVILGISKDDTMNLSIVYRPSSGATNQLLIDRLSNYQQALSSAYTGIVFDADSGSFKVNDLYSMLYIGYQYNGQNVRQYVTVMGENMIVITFNNVDKNLAETLIANGFGVPS